MIYILGLLANICRENHNMCTTEMISILGLLANISRENLNMRTPEIANICRENSKRVFYIIFREIFYCNGAFSPDDLSWLSCALALTVLHSGNPLSLVRAACSALGPTEKIVPHFLRCGQANVVC